MRKRFFQEHFPLGKIDNDFLFADTKEKNDNFRRFLQNLIKYSGLLESEQDYILLPKKISKSWYCSFKLSDYIRYKFGSQYTFKLLNYCWPERTIEPDDSTQPHWHLFDFHTVKYSSNKKFLEDLILFVRHIYTNIHWRIGPQNKIFLVGGYAIENLFIIAQEIGGFDNLLEKLDLESIYRQVCNSNVSRFAKMFFPEINPQLEQKNSNSTAAHCFHQPLFTTQISRKRLGKYLLGMRYIFPHSIISGLNEGKNIGMAPITKEFGGIYTPTKLCRIFPLNIGPSNRCTFVREDSLIVPDRILALNILEAGKIALERNYNLTQLSLVELQSWVTGIYYREILKQKLPELIFKRPTNFQDLPKDEREEMIVALVLKAQNGDKAAKSIICEEYQEMVWRISRKYFCPGQNEWDLFQHGNIGLLRAINDFNPIKNNAFNPFVIVCIERSITDTIKTATRKKRQSEGTFSLNAYLGNKNDRTFLDIIPGPESVDPFVKIADEESLEDLMSYLTKILSPRQRQVFIELLSTERKSLSEIAKKLNMKPKSVDNDRTKIKEKIKEKVFPLFPHLATLIRS